MEIITFILAISGFCVILFTTFVSWIYIPVTYFVVRFFLRYAYEPDKVKDRPKWKLEADGTALLLALALMLLHFVGVPISWVIGVFGPFGLLLVDLWGMALMAIFTLIFVVSAGAAFGTMMRWDGEIPRKIGTGAGYTWIGIGPIVISLLKVIGNGILFILMLPVYFVQGFMS